MDIVKCDGCGKVLEPKTDIYYSVKELCRHQPKSNYRVIFHEGERKLTAEDTGNVTLSEPVGWTTVGWVDYRDLDYCVACIQQPIDIAPYLRTPRE